MARLAEEAASGLRVNSGTEPGRKRRVPLPRVVTISAEVGRASVASAPVADVAVRPVPACTSGKSAGRYAAKLCVEAPARSSSPQIRIDARPREYLMHPAQALHEQARYTVGTPFPGRDGASAEEPGARKEPGGDTMSNPARLCSNGC